MQQIFYVIAMSFILFSCNATGGNTVRNSGGDISETSSIIRDKTTKAASLQIAVDGKWILYAGNSVETIDLSSPIAKGDKAGIYPLSVSAGTRSYFFLKMKKGTAVLSERHLPMTGGYNFRDMGGFRNSEGKYVKWGKVFRADDLYGLTGEDITYLNSIPLRSVVDFRSLAEAEQAPDRLPASASVYRLPVVPGNLNVHALDGEDMTPEQAVIFMTDINRSFSKDPAVIDRYRIFFRMLQDETKIPLVFHCSAGKDRTGMAAALFLYALGVEEEVIFEDYLSSNIYLADKYAGTIERFPDLKPFFEVRKEYLQAGIEQIRQDHGSVENYLINVLHADTAKLKSLYL